MAASVVMEEAHNRSCITLDKPVQQYLFKSPGRMTFIVTVSQECNLLVLAGLIETKTLFSSC